MKHRIKAPYGLKARFLINLLFLGVLCILLFFFLYGLTDSFLVDCLASSGFEEFHLNREAESLQLFIDRNDISLDSLSRLVVWERRHPVSYMEVFIGNSLVYRSFEPELVTEDEALIFLNISDGSRKSMSVTVDGKVANVYVYADFIYNYYILGTVVSFVLSLLVFILLFLRSIGKLISYVIRLKDEVQILEGGNLDYEVSVQGNDEITDLAISMNRMRVSIRLQMDEEQKLHDGYRQLITEMSHDLRTPLTSIMLYLQILRSRKYESEAQLQDYLAKIDAKAHHMKNLSDYLLECSLEEFPQRQSKLQTMENLFSETLREFRDDLETRGYTVNMKLEWPNAFVQVEREYLQRIFGNIVSNITKYAESNSEVRVETLDEDRYCGFMIMNVCMPEESMGNVVDSNGIGIESIRNMMNHLGGSVLVEKTDRFFQMVLLFPRR